MRARTTLAVLALPWASACSALGVEAAPATAADWRGAYDLDGDGAADRIVSAYSGGAHCCYAFGAYLSSREETVMLPFWLDGGFGPGRDLIDAPERFAVAERDDGPPEILVEIAVYSGEPAALEDEWRSRYGVRSHCIAVSFAGGRIDVRNRDERSDGAGRISCPQP